LPAVVIGGQFATGLRRPCDDAAMTHAMSEGRDDSPGAVAVSVRREDLLGPVAQPLIAALNADLTGRYPEEGACSFRLDPDEVAPGRGAFLVAYLGDRAVGCGALRRLDAAGPAPGDAEIKRMYVVPSARGRGVGQALVAALEAEGRLLAVRRLILETGVRQPEAVALYTRTGFAVIPAFGDYVGKALSICMAKELK
jgi:putative acetyltransferase